MGNEVITVLVVDDEKEVADAYALRVRGRYDVRTAYGGKEALEMLDTDVDVVLLDRRMPEIPGDEILGEIRDRDLDCRVIMITAIDPDFSIIDMPFDDYLCKPIAREDLLSAIDHQVRIIAYERLSEYFQYTSTRAVLEAEMDRHSLEQHDEYVELKSQVEALKAELAELLDGFDDITQTFDRIEREGV